MKTKKKKLTARGLPYNFFSRQSHAPNLNFSWFQNDVYYLVALSSFKRERVAKLAGDPELTRNPIESMPSMFHYHVLKREPKKQKARTIIIFQQTHTYTITTHLVAILTKLLNFRGKNDTN